MDAVPAKILRLLEKQQLKPGALAHKLGISRQALHRHLRSLVEAKRIQKHGAGPHVVYSVASNGAGPTRVKEDYALCRRQFLQRYQNEFAGLLERYVQRPRKQGAASKKSALDFGFLLDAAAVYSSNIEGNTLDLNSFLNSRMSPRKHRPKEAQEIEDLVSAYAYARKNNLDEKNMLHAHNILSRQFVAKSRQGIYRREPVGVFSRHGLEYMAVEPHFVGQEMHALFKVISELLRAKHTPAERFFWAAWLHLTFALIHPFSDGNGRTARLCEKWFLFATLGEQSFSIPSEEQYWNNRSRYYAALKLGVNYWETDMSTAFQFFVLLPQSLTGVLGKD